MSTIAKKIGGFMFTGATQPLATASFKDKLNVVYGFNANGNGYVSFKPTSAFNSLTQLVQDGVYIVDAKTLGFELPGAVLTVAATGPVAEATLTFTERSVLGNVFRGKLQSSVSSDTVARVLFVWLDGVDYNSSWYTVPIGQLFELTPNYGTIKLDEALFVTAVALGSGASCLYQLSH